MKIINKNLQGVNNPRKVKTLQNKLRKEKPDVLFLQQTKWSLDTDARGTVGGIAIL